MPTHALSIHHTLVSCQACPTLSQTLLIRGCYILLELSSCKPSVTLTGLETRMTATRLLVLVSTWAIVWSLGVLRNKLSCLDPALRQSTAPWLSPLLNYSDYACSSKNSAFPHFTPSVMVWQYQCSSPCLQPDLPCSHQTHRSWLPFYPREGHQWRHSHLIPFHSRPGG